MNFKEFKRYWSDFVKSNRGQKIINWSRRLFLVGVIAWLLYQLTTIGWGNVWHSLPLNPLFYLLYLMIYVSLPVAQLFIYRLTWTFKFRNAFPVLLLTKVYNQDVMGYSGEVYFYFWARKNIDIKEIEILKTIKDNNIISSASSTLVAFGLLGVFLLTGQIRLLDFLHIHNIWYLYGGIALFLIVIIILIRFRHYIISMPFKTAGTIFSIHVFRLLLGQSLQIIQWHLILPNIPLYVWFTFVAVQIMMSRIPFLPNRDLIFFGASLKLTQMMHVPTAAIAAIMLANSVFGKIMNVVLFSLTSFFKDKDILPSPDGNTNIPATEDIAKESD
ncbi:MAG TPA: hypothetical protein VJ991_15395 [Balneolales bacterium]|nr:hypothetical protein [Balneolales bacterium]